MTQRDDHIGQWTERKQVVLREYMQAYSTILAAQRHPGGHQQFSHVYIDAFASSGEHVSRTSGKIVLGSPLSAMRVEPPFKDYYFIDIDPSKMASLQRRVGDRPDVHYLKGDANELLIKQVFPQVRWEDYRRGLCVLDPYGLTLKWDVLVQAARSRTLDVILNFPIHDANRNALHRDLATAPPEQRDRFTTLWGDESWLEEGYELDLFSQPRKSWTNADLMASLRRRLQEVAGFPHVSEPLEFRNSTRATVFFLLVASQKDAAVKIANDIIRKHRR